ncbi:MAG: ORF6N domain-containing protein [Bacteroidales bacterium]|nr:ORF6N domain-containing protein [Bacteroidales bacterium]
MLDADLADLYGVKTKRLNEQVNRNISRFPVNFMFKLTDEEIEKIVASLQGAFVFLYPSSYQRQISMGPGKRAEGRRHKA